VGQLDEEETMNSGGTETAARPLTPHEGHNLSDVRETDIVVGVDGSPSSKAALRWALEQARRVGGRVQAVAAWEYAAYSGWVSAYPLEDFAGAAGKVLAESVTEALGTEPADVEVLESVMAGHPAQVLIDASARAGLLVVGCRGHGAFAGTLLGSVSQHCAQHARCPVVVVRGKG
jgi:nucleotide-binding universal stress UspA family protein